MYVAGETAKEQCAVCRMCEQKCGGVGVPTVVGSRQAGRGKLA